MAKRGLHCFKLEGYFDGVVGMDECTKHKPDPEPMLIGAKRININPKNCLCVGDSPYDLLSGRAAGAKTVAVNWTSVDSKVFDKYIVPDYRIDKMTDLLEIINELNTERV